MDVNKALADINLSTDHKTKTEKYKVLLIELVKAKNVQNLRTFIDHSIQIIQTSPMLLIIISSAIIVTPSIFSYEYFGK